MQAMGSWVAWRPLTTGTFGHNDLLVWDALCIKKWPGTSHLTSLVEPTDETTPFLIYYENFSKNNSGGLSNRKVMPKQVKHHANLANPNRCLVNLFKKYIGHRPETTETSFYLTPLKKPRSNAWYTKTPVGHNTLGKTVSRLCKAGGITGYKTNHSLRVTAATRLFQSGVDEQLIMDRTGHRSLDGVRRYKRISDEQRQTTSDILNAATNGDCSAPCPLSKKPRVNENESSSSFTSITISCISNSQVAISNNFNMPKSNKDYSFPQIIFNGCSSITVNYNYN
jgi:hypothetical protein